MVWWIMIEFGTQASQETVDNLNHAKHELEKTVHR